MDNYFFLTLLLEGFGKKSSGSGLRNQYFVEALTATNSEGFSAFRLLSIHPGYRIQRIIRSCLSSIFVLSENTIVI